MPLKLNITKLVRGQKGQGLLEYIILSGLIGIFCLVAVKQFGSVLRERIEDMKEEVVKNIKIK